MVHFESDSKYFLVLHRHDDLVESINKFIKEKSIQGGQITGIGALEDVELGLYDLTKKTYVKKHFGQTELELVSLTGNISLKDGNPFAHIHVVVSDGEMRCFGGHLFKARVSVTAELSIVALGVMPERTMNPQMGLALINSVK